MTRTASASMILPDAGKPTGRCEECGPHGNDGRVELLFSVVDCLVCAWRADFDALCKVDDFNLELLSQAQPGETVVLTQEIAPLDPARVWGRRVKVTCTYSTAPTDAPQPMTAHGVAVELCAACSRSTVGDPRRLASRDIDPSWPPAFVCGTCRLANIPMIDAPKATDRCLACYQEIGDHPRVVPNPSANPPTKWVHADPADCGVRGINLGPLPSFKSKVVSVP